tara:strand:- start:824 stop:1180 length:357 start_codon:yes stop_codon:yes gene_type:complete
MSTQVVSGCLNTTGPKGALKIPVKTTVTDGSQTEVKTDSSVTVTSMSVGIYGENQVLRSGMVSAKTGLIYCTIVNNGIVRAVIPITSRTSGASGCADMRIQNNITLVPGDQLLVETYA